MQHQKQSITQQGLLQDLLAPTTLLFPYEEDNLLFLATASSYANSSSFLHPYTNESIYSSIPSFDTFTPLNASGSSSFDQQMAPIQEQNALMVEQDDDLDQDFKINDEIPRVFSMELSEDKKNKSKKVQGQPSKNLMAERRRRKRLNDRLSMLRSIVPKISKMDRTSILGDTIDYMKELLEKINNLKVQDMEADKLVESFKDEVRNPPKFDVERRNIDTQIQICCSTKPGLLLSTVNTLEALGLDVQECVISCFNDFSLQASCSEALEHRGTISSEDIKQILFRNAGFGGRCL